MVNTVRMEYVTFMISDKNNSYMKPLLTYKFVRLCFPNWLSYMSARLSQYPTCFHRIEERKQELFTAVEDRRDWIATLDDEEREEYCDESGESQLHKVFLAMFSKDEKPHQPGQ